LLINGSLGIALGAQPTNATIAIHPIIDIGLAVKAGDFPGFSAGVLSHDSPVSSDLRTGLKVTLVFAMTHYAGNTFKRQT
jgi:hypothetical protein